jgi:phytoene desaturase
MDALEGTDAVTSVLVIGAGIGGIAAAARLAHHGYDVTVVEKGARPGGRCSRLVKDGHTFDTGPTLILFPQLYAQAFSDLGERIEDHLDLRRVDPAYRIHFEDNTSLISTSDLSAMRGQLETIEPGSFNGLLRYLSEGHRHHRLAFANLIGRSFHRPTEFYNLKTLVMLLRLRMLTQHYANVGRYFSDPRLKAAFTFQDMYLSLSPYEAPATFSLLTYSELAEGVWFPVGGMYRLIEALTRIGDRSGVEFIYDSSVAQINCNGRRVTGVTLGDARRVQADLVVANADLSYVYRCLLPDDGAAARLGRKLYSCSTVMFYWGVDRNYPQFLTHNLFLAGDYRQSYERVLKDHTLPDEPSFYLHAPARVDPSLAPEGQDTLMVAVPVGHIDDTAHQDWRAIQKRARELVLARLAATGTGDIRDHIKFEVSYTPRTWLNRYNLTYGATLGLAHNLTQMGYLRPHNRHRRYRNLYFVGASTHPGSGVPSVLLSSRFVTQRILADSA